MTKACTTHHHACACRESHFRRLQQDNSWAVEKLSGMAIELAELRELLDKLRIEARHYRAVTTVHRPIIIEAMLALLLESSDE